MASLPPPPPGIDLQADKGPHIVSSGIALIVLPTVFVVLRLISRYLAEAGFWWDDLLVVTSLLLSYGPNGCMMDCEFFRFPRYLFPKKLTMRQRREPMASENIYGPSRIRSTIPASS